MPTTEIQATCAYDDCENTGESYNDDENFTREHFGHCGPSTKCLECNRTF